MITPGKGTLLQLGAGSGPIVYTTVAQRLSIGGPSMENSEKDDTNLDSECKKTAAALLDAGEVDMQCQLDVADPQQSALYALFQSGAEAPFKLILNDAPILANRSNITFDAWAKGYAPSGFEIESNAVVDIKLRVNTIPVITPRTGS